MIRLLPALLVALPLLGSALPAVAAGGTVYVETTSGSYDDSLTGGNARDYVVQARQGERLEVLLSAKNDDVFFRVLGPGGNGLYNSNKEGNHLDGLKIGRSGSYVVQVGVTKDVEKGHERHYSLMVNLQ
ncbi:MAG: hypothetical protein U1E59_19150 [Amaricoccus sp.]